MTKIPSLYGNRIFRIAAAMIVTLIYFFGLTVPLLGPDEPRYSQVAREMFERGDWLTPTLGGFHWFEKPVLLYWLQIVSYQTFGVSEFSARFGSALFGLATVGSLWMLGRAYGRALKVEGNDLAFCLAVVSASSIGLIAFARGASFDIVLTFPITASMVSFFAFELRENSSERLGHSVGPSLVPLFLFYFFTGLSLLAKGLIGIVFPFAIVAFYYILSWRIPPRRVSLSFVWGSVIALLVAASWYVPMYLRHGWEFIDEFFIQHHFQRYTSNKYLHPQPFYFFLLVLPAMTFPWLPFFLAAVWRYSRMLIGQTKDGRKNADTETASQDIENNEHFMSLVRFAFAWMLVPLVFFSFSGSKLPGYILPALPPALVLTTLYVTRFISKRQDRERVVLAVAGAMFALVVVLLLTALPRFADTDSVRRLIESADRLGYRDRKVLMFHTISHNAEFYAPGRLLRDETGKQRKLVSPAEIREECIKSGAKSCLVLLPVEYWKQLTASPLVTTDVISDNGEFVILEARAVGN